MPYTDVIPACSSSVNGTCYESFYGKGAVVYDKYMECYDNWIMLPGFLLLPDELLALVFFFVLIYCFFGVAIISDVFMSSIDVITEKEKVVTRKTANGDIIQFSVKYWNPTVANLTLMALGSSKNPRPWVPCQCSSRPSVGQGIELAPGVPGEVRTQTSVPYESIRDQ